MKRLGCRMHYAEPAMSTQSILQKRSLPKYFGDPADSASTRWDIAMTINIAADTRRIFQALTEPEYREIWVSLPGNDASCYMTAWQTAESFRLDHYRGGKRDLIISGEYRICRRHKLLFTWTRKDTTISSESLVCICLHGNFSSSILELHHRGLNSAEEYLWHQEMWRDSLEHLVALF